MLASLDSDLVLLEKHSVPTRDLITFYRKRLAAAEAEREDAMRRVLDVEAQNADLNRARFERRSREEEVRELQRALSDAKKYLFDEREQLLRVQGENDELRAQEIEDRKRIAHLLALTEPMTQEFTYFRSAASKEPAAVASKGPVVGRAGFPVVRPNGGSPGHARTRVSDAAAASLPSGGGIASGPVKLSGDVRVLKSVALPGVTGDPAAAEMRVVALSHQLEELRRLGDERAAASERERAAAADAAATGVAKAAARIRELEGAVEGLQSKLTSLTRDYLVQRHEFGARERALTEEATVARAARAEAEAELARVNAAADAEIRAARSSTEAQASALAGLMSARADQFDDAVQAVTVRAHEGAAALANELAKVKASLKRERERYRALETRRSLDLEGFSNDIAALKRTLRSVELTAASAAAAAADDALERPAALLHAARADAIAYQGEFQRALPHARMQREPRHRDAESAIAEFARNLAEANGPAQPEDDEFAEALARAAAKRRGVASVRATVASGSPTQVAASSGPRRVPFSSPVAAPRYAPHAGSAPEPEAPASSVKGQRAVAPPVIGDSRDARAQSIETQLADLHGRIAELDARARRFAH